MNTLASLAPKRAIAIARQMATPELLRFAQAAAQREVPIEVALSSRDSLDQISAVIAAVPGASVGAGTVTSVELARSAIAVGASFVLTPNTNLEVIEHLVDRDIPCVAGAFSPTEVFAASEAGATAVKVFPAASVGPSYIRQLLGPFPDLDLVAVGGIGASNARSFLDAGCGAVGVGSSLTSASDPAAALSALLDALRTTTSDSVT